MTSIISCNPSLQKHDIGATHTFTPNEGWEYGFEMPYNAMNWVVGGWVTILGSDFEKKI